MGKGYAWRQAAPVNVSRGGLVTSMAGGFSAWHSKGSLCHSRTLREVMPPVCSSVRPTPPLQPQ